MKLRKMNVNNKGFSLVELMIVVAIIGLLAAIGVPQYAKFQARARQSEAKAALGALYSAEQSFFQEWNKYSVDLKNVGFGVTGQNLRYVTGFNPGAGCTGYAAAGNPGAPAEVTAATNTLSNGGSVAGLTTLYPDANTRPSFAAAPINFQTKAAVTAPAVSCDDAAAGGPVFTGTSEGDPKNTPVALTADRWTINQAKLMSNTVSGL